jgi:L-cysteine S-thiosulfotransferase
MKRGERAVLAVIGVLVAGAALRAVLQPTAPRDREIPFYSTAPANVAARATDLIREQGCRRCHSLWSTRDLMQAVPAPMLDGIGSLRTEVWLYDYLSAAAPQAVLPSRLKPEYRMPSYAALPEADRRTLASYLASLQVKDWYLDQTRRMEHDKLTGESTAER